MKTFVYICLLLGLSLNSQAKMEDAQSKVPPLKMSCSVAVSTNTSYASLNVEEEEMTIDGKIEVGQAFSLLYVPTWKKEITYKAGKDYSVQVSIIAVKYQQRGDFLHDKPRLYVTASILRAGKVISKATAESEAVVPFKNEIKNTSGRAIDVNLSLENLLPSAAADNLSTAMVECQMPINWKFTGKAQ